MMVLAGKAVQWALGSAALPLALIGMLVMAGKWVTSSREALIAQGEAKCESRWEIELARTERDVALANVRVMESQLKAADVLNTEIRANARDIEQQFAEARAVLASLPVGPTDQRGCLSDSVRELARGVSGDGDGKKRTPAKSDPRRRAP